LYVVRHLPEDEVCLIIPRKLQLPSVIRRSSIFLFGPRQTGKTTLVRAQFPEARYYNLLESDTFRELATRPEIIRKRLTKQDRVIVIDEVQRMPKLLNEIQAIIDNRPDVRFVLTGSSARSLRRGGVNLLGGRAGVINLHPLVASELDVPMIEKRVEIGSLPRVLLSSTAIKDLRDYVGVYLNEEIRAESLVRNIETFSRFLEVAALSNGELVNFANIGSDSGVPPRTIREHFHILQDTLLGTLLPPYQKTVKRKPVSTAKFYLFDVGVANILMKRERILPGSREFGETLEHLIFCELSAYLSYSESQRCLSFWCSQSQLEVDFVIGDEVAIEVKAAERVRKSDLKGLRALAEEIPLKRKIIVCMESSRWQEDDGIEIVPVSEFLQELAAGTI
jgi:predicted AAA+ superfamily ATPase